MCVCVPVHNVPVLVFPDHFGRRLSHDANPLFTMKAAACVALLFIRLEVRPEVARRCRDDMSSLPLVLGIFWLRCEDRVLKVSLDQEDAHTHQGQF